MILLLSPTNLLSILVYKKKKSSWNEPKYKYNGNESNILNKYIENISNFKITISSI